MKEEDKKQEIVAANANDGMVYDAEVIGEQSLPDEKIQSQPPQRPFWMDLIVIVGVYMGCRIVFELLAGLFAKITHGDLLRFAMIAQIAVYAVVLPFSVWLLRKRGMKKPILSFSFKKADPLMILWGFLLLFIMGVVIEPVLSLFPAEYLDNVNNAMTGSGGLGMFMAVVFVPVCEEMLFRGVIQGGSSREYGPLRAILVAAAIFGVVHMVPQQVVNAFFAGIILGYVYYRTGSLIPVILIHMLNNAIAYIIARMSAGSEAASMRELVNSDVWYWIIYGVCAVIFVFALVNLWRQLNKADKKAQLETK